MTKKRIRTKKYKCSSKIYGINAEPLDKRKCLRCDKFFYPDSRVNFSCETCNNYIRQMSLGD